MKIAPLHTWIPNLERPLVIAGPCSAESEEQMLATAKQISEIEGINYFRAGIWKPRTRPNCFEGVGEIGLTWLSLVKKETNLKITTEVATAKHAELALKYGVDALWIGARTSANPFSVQEIADVLKGVDIPVMVKNPVNADLALWIGALERFNGAGITKLAAIHRGFSTGEKSQFRNLPKWNIPIELKSLYPELPIICDPSHISGNRDLISMLCQKAMDVDFDGVMVETHINPEKALSDAAQQITPTTLNEIISNLSLRKEFSANKDFESELNVLRGQIDRIDQEVIESLQMRMNIISKIGQAKKDNDVTPLQIHRMDELMQNRLEKAQELGLNEKYIRDLYHLIHTESVRVQSEIVNDFN
jgi:chorismate mutase